jgi:hypothetical protein
MATSQTVSYKKEKQHQRLTTGQGSSLRQYLDYRPDIVLIFHNLEETFMPYFSYGFSPLMGLRTKQFHYIEAPLPELYDFNADPEESHNLLAAPGGDLLKIEWSKNLASAISIYGKDAPVSKERLPIPNVNADHAATAIAAKLGAIKLIFVSNVPGILVAGRVVRAVTADPGYCHHRA